MTITITINNVPREIDGKKLCIAIVQSRAPYEVSIPYACAISSSTAKELMNELLSIRSRIYHNGVPVQIQSNPKS